MKEIAKETARQAVPVLITAFLAAGFSFFQSLAVNAGVCPVQAMSPETSGVVGAMLKSAHQAWAAITYRA